MNAPGNKSTRIIKTKGLIVEFIQQKLDQVLYHFALSNTRHFYSSRRECLPLNRLVLYNKSKHRYSFRLSKAVANIFQIVTLTNPNHIDTYEEKIKLFYSVLVINTNDIYAAYSLVHNSIRLHN